MCMLDRKADLDMRYCSIEMTMRDFFEGYQQKQYSIYCFFEKRGSNNNKYCIFAPLNLMPEPIRTGCRG